MERMHHFIHRVQLRVCLLILIASSTACSDSMEIEKQVFDETYFSPPTWILGTWEEIPDEQQEDMISRTFKFTGTNFLVNPLSREIDQIDYNEYINRMRGFLPSLEVDIQVEKTEELYELSISPPILRDNYRFKKVDEDTIICRTHLGSYTVFEFRLKRVE